MALKSDFLFEGLTDFWDNLREADRNVILGLWDAMLRMASDLTVEILQTDRAKSLQTVPVTFKTIFVPFVFNDKTRNTIATAPAGFEVDAFDIDSTINSIPSLLNAAVQDLNFVIPDVLKEGTDYKIENGIIFWATDAPAFALAPQVLEDRKLIEENFGTVVGLKGASTQSFLSKVRGAWFALWNGPTIENVELIVAIPLGLPFTEPGKIISISDDGANGLNVTIKRTIDDAFVVVNIPAPLNATIEVGQVIESFESISDAIRISDLISDPGFAKRFGLEDVKEFFTFIPIIDANVLFQLIDAGIDFDFTVASQLLEKIKPEYADSFIGIKLDQTDEADLVLFTAEDKVRFDATASFNMNYVNWMSIPEFESLNLDETTYSTVLTERKTFDVGEDTIAIRDRFIVKDVDTGGEIAGDDPPVGYGINYGGFYGG